MRWCKKLAQKLSRDAAVRTGSQLDTLPVGVDVASVPADILTADWNHEAYQEAPTISTDEASYQLLDGALTVDRERSNSEIVRIVAEWDALTIDLSYSPGWAPCFRLAGRDSATIRVHQGSETARFIEYINEHPLYLHLVDGSQLEGALHTPAGERVVRFDLELIEVRPWDELGVDIQYECGEPRDGKSSIQDCIARGLLESDCAVVFIDHGKGEMADFVAVSETPQQAAVSFYHCKASTQPRAGSRLADIYEICGQAVKSRHWFSEAVLMRQIKRRARGGRSRFLKGSLPDLERALRRRDVEPKYQVILVQPGLSKGCLSDQVSMVLGVTHEGIYHELREPLRVIASS